MTAQYYIDQRWPTVNCTLSSIVKLACYIAKRNRFSHCIYFLLVYKVFYMSALNHRHLTAVKAETPAHLLQLKSNLL